MTDETPILRVEGLAASYGPVRALTSVSFEVPPGSVLAVLGPNGAGKSTLSRVIAGLVPASDGRIWLAGVDVTHWPAHQRRRAGLVLLPEQRAIFPSLSVLENLTLASCRAESRAQRRGLVDDALAMFPILADRRSQQAGLLSGGEQQMLSLARAFAMQPRVVLADEPSHGLAPKLVDSTYEALHAASSRGMAIVVVEQFVHHALGLADIGLILQRGAVTWTGAAEAAAAEAERRYLGKQEAGR